MKSSSQIKKKFSLNNIQILSKYELQNKFISILKFIKPNDILSDLTFFEEISIYFDSSKPEKAFITYKFTLYCYNLINQQESNFFLKLFLKYSKIFIKTGNKYYFFIIIKIIINDIFDEKKKNLSINEFNLILNNLLEEYKNSPYNSIINMDINNFIKNDINKSFFFILLDSLKFPFDKDQIKAISKYVVSNSKLIIKNILINKL